MRIPAAIAPCGSSGRPLTDAAAYRAGPDPADLQACGRMILLQNMAAFSI